jgi:hypothetical protein
VHAEARVLLDAHLPEGKQALLAPVCISFAWLTLMVPTIQNRSAQAAATAVNGSQGMANSAPAGLTDPMTQM